MAKPDRIVRDLKRLAPLLDRADVRPKEAYLALLGEKIALLKTLCARARAGAPEPAQDVAQALCQHAGTLTSHGRTHGYPLVAAVAGSLSRLLRGRGAALDAHDWALAAHHIDALALIQTHALAGDGGAEGRSLVERLNGLVTEALQ